MKFTLILIAVIFIPVGISGVITYFLHKYSKTLIQKNIIKKFDFAKCIITTYAILMTIVLLVLFAYLIANTPIKGSL